ncbi:unnamed protein product [Orchesella dallaii]|uniref:Uncharacterized protein n=1 Tax=Orchesella dallaii TaxID=48710 RepID=A0ABP1RM30_9HEXA
MFNNMKVFALILTFTLIFLGLSKASRYDACQSLCGGGSGYRRSSPMLYPLGSNTWAPYPPGSLIRTDYGPNRRGGTRGISGRVGEGIGGTNGFDISGNLVAEWETKFGIDAVIEGYVDGFQEHEQLTNFADGSYIKDKDGLKWGLKATIRPTFSSQTNIKGTINFGGR